MNTISGIRIHSDVFACLDGGGTINLYGDFNRIDGANTDGNDVLVNLNNTIQGSGCIGDRGVNFVNESDGVIISNIDNGFIVIDPPFKGYFNNHGILRAANGGSVLLCGECDNTGGLIQAVNMESRVFLMGPSILGGTLQASSQATLAIETFAEVMLDSVRIVGDLEFERTSGDYIALAGSILNQGRVIASGENSIFVDDFAQLEGGGIIILDSFGMPNDCKIADMQGSDGMLVNVDNLITGDGFVGADSLIVVNEKDGIISSNTFLGSQPMVIDPPDATPMVNRGCLQADRDELILRDGTIDNTGGVIRAFDEGVVSLENIEIHGGTFESTDGGIVKVRANRSATISDCEIENGFEVSGDGELSIAGTIVNQGRIDVLGTTANNARVLVQPGASIQGPGRLNLLEFFATIEPDGKDVNLRFDGGTIMGRGQVMTKLELANATISPNTSVADSFTISSIFLLNDQTVFEGNNRIVVDVDSANGNPGINWDSIVSGSQVEFMLPKGTKLTIELNTVDGVGNLSPLGDFDQSLEYEFPILSAIGITGLEPEDVDFDLTNFINNFGGEFSAFVRDAMNGQELIVKYGQLE